MTGILVISTLQVNNLLNANKYVLFFNYAPTVFAFKPQRSLVQISARALHVGSYLPIPAI